MGTYISVFAILDLRARNKALEEKNEILQFKYEVKEVYARDLVQQVNEWKAIAEEKGK